MLIDVTPHPTHEGIYVSPEGEIYRRLSASLGAGGYHTVKIGKGGTVRRHTLMLESFKGPANGRLTRHLDGNPGNDSVGNLEWGTQKENGGDSIKHGTTTRGEKNARAKITASNVLEIRGRLATGESICSLAREFLVSDTCIHDLRAKRTWGWL